jgi:hypothetical protein
MPTVGRKIAQTYDKIRDFSSRHVRYFGRNQIAKFLDYLLNESFPSTSQ